jgi:hypothetical protein
MQKVKKFYGVGAFLLSKVECCKYMKAHSKVS